MSSGGLVSHDISPSGRLIKPSRLVAMKTLKNRLVDMFNDFWEGETQMEVFRIQFIQVSVKSCSKNV